MFLIALYLIAIVTWGLVFYDMAKAITVSVKSKSRIPRLLVPLAISSLALVIENLYFFIANIIRYFIDDESYLFFVEQDNLFIIKLFIAISGVIMAMILRTGKKD